MDHRLKCKIQNYKLLEKMGENLCDPGPKQSISLTPKAPSIKGKSDKYSEIKMREIYVAIKGHHQ